MIIIAGLGNPGRKYEKTRHNCGYAVIDILSDRYGIDVNREKFKAMTGTGMIDGVKVLLLKPLTYMNLSGTAVAEAVHFYKLDPATQLLVISDDIDLEPGRLRIRKQGSAGGQNGLKHIIKCLGTDEFARIRVGTGQKPEGWDLADWVLSRFSGDDRAKVDEALDRAALAAECWVSEGADAAMNRYNASDKKAKKVKKEKPVSDEESQ